MVENAICGTRLSVLMLRFICSLFQLFDGLNTSDLGYINIYLFCYIVCRDQIAIRNCGF
jgi:hypothetical protein